MTRKQANSWEGRMAAKARERRVQLQQEEYEAEQRAMEDEFQISEPPEDFVGPWA